ncbi:hypothetical protein GYMLUDRAFT_42289 [Collybiopsis luxurians FD-317 M1]|uniref:BTB domain-containing protein n=1 Tax=Collybiopsis luxurians FD-317 M1 TaxID=944289 RepID=A0A0D0CZC0_9AGAR|nr:hypothetical protein GYMLUDRAFT_42289 [Collybiopsis luxurians FD-317 M1]
MEAVNWDSILQFPDSQDNVSEFMSDLNVTAPVIQVPTPPIENESVSISTAFGVHAKCHALPPDLVFVTSDSVMFFVHSHIVLAASDNQFHSLVPKPSTNQSPNPMIHVPDTSETFNIILHLIYNLPSSQYTPSFDTISKAVNRLSFYGIQAETYIIAKTPLHNLILSFAPILPIEVYILAAKHNLLDLAIPASSHLLSFDLSTLTEEKAEAMGAKYLRKLFFLHIGRSNALKRLLLKPPLPHPPTASCSFDDQKCLTRAWALASAYLVLDARPDLSIGALESCLNPLAQKLACDECRASLHACVKNVIVNWSQVKNTTY